MTKNIQDHDYIAELQAYCDQKAAEGNPVELCFTPGSDYIPDDFDFLDSPKRPPAAWTEAARQAAAKVTLALLRYEPGK